MDAAAREFVLNLGTALQGCGAPSHRLESALSAVSARLGVEGQFFTTPTQLVAGFGPLHDQRTAMVRVEPGEVDLARMRALDELAEEVVAGEVDLEEGIRRIEAIRTAPKRYSSPLVVVAYGVTSAAVARFFDGGPAEITIAAIIGLSIGALSLFFTRTIGGSRVFDLIASFAAAAMALGATHLGFEASFQVTTLAGIIALIPGLTLTVAMAELATRNLVSGTARLTSAAIVFLELAFGVAMAEALMTRLFGAAERVHDLPLPIWTEPIALVLGALAIAVLFQSHPRTLAGIVAASALAFYGARFGAWLVGPQLGAAIGAFLLALASNIYARVQNRPSLLLLVPGILLLVPGSLGFRSLTAMVHRDILSGIDAAFAMVLVAISLVAGLLVANAAVSPRRNL